MRTAHPSIPREVLFHAAAPLVETTIMCSYANAAASFASSVEDQEQWLAEARQIQKAVLDEGPTRVVQYLLEEGVDSDTIARRVDRLHRQSPVDTDTVTDVSTSEKEFPMPNPLEAKQRMHAMISHKLGEHVPEPFSQALMQSMLLHQIQDVLLTERIEQIEATDSSHALEALVNEIEQHAKVLSRESLDSQIHWLFDHGLEVEDMELHLEECFSHIQAPGIHTAPDMTSMPWGVDAQERDADNVIPFPNKTEDHEDDNVLDFSPR